MTVKELKKSMEGIPDDAEVILSSDGEGNSYRKCYAAESDVCITDKWEVEILDEEDADRFVKEGKVCLVLWPE